MQVQTFIWLATFCKRYGSFFLFYFLSLKGFQLSLLAVHYLAYYTMCEVSYPGIQDLTLLYIFHMILNKSDILNIFFLRN